MGPRSRPKSSTASTHNCRNMRIWSACYRRASSTTWARRFGWHGGGMRRIPRPRYGRSPGLLVGAQNTFAAIGAADDEPGFIAFYRRCRLVTERLWPTLLEPLRTRTQMHRHVLDGNRPEADAAWRAITEEPIGHAIAAAVGNDLVRGVIATDALIGTFAGVNDPSLRQNICLLYHLLGGGTGHWDVPVGGMGSVTAALAAAATSHGAEIVTGADVYAVDPEGEVWYRCGGEECRIRAESSWPASPGGAGRPAGPARPPLAEGCQVKVNMVVRRLPRLRDDGVTAEQAFGGTFHVNETWTQLDAAYSRAASGGLPEPLPCEVYCHSLTDPSVLSAALRDSGAATLTVFGLHTPHTLRADRSPGVAAISSPKRSSPR
ncbi:hypothetical protein I552_1838 [Mycobacterium xenopi 3993]|nr:hypothetical protein I552_1838 [Mycobacterium xenopi 3993]